jgi:hypothetical protein
MLEPQSVSVYLNNALKATPQLAEFESAIPDEIRNMPDEVHGHFVSLDDSLAHEMGAAWKCVMMLNGTHVLYTFRYDPATANFVATKR